MNRVWAVPSEGCQVAVPGPDSGVCLCPSRLLGHLGSGQCHEPGPHGPHRSVERSHDGKGTIDHNLFSLALRTEAVANEKDVTNEITYQKYLIPSLLLSYEIGTVVFC